MAAKIKLGILLFFILSVFSFSFQKHALSADEIIDLVNQGRGKAGVAPLKLNPILNQAAEAKASDMMLKRYFAHISPEGTKPWYWFKRAGYNYVYAGENLALGYTDPVELVDSWMASPSHRANILSPFYSDLGLGVVASGNKTLIVEFFGSKDNKLTLRQ
ncbi:MAG: hypothetical protein HY545_00730 [Candidatus Doudnabacteria bacterium]|nr:hypothetical protein [Candidatus Doudnabacteria bacterium]